MADRRMFSKAITNSAKFLKMPLETQALYFHLAQNADDDGVVEGFTIMRLVGAADDSLKVLVGKNYIRILNDDLVLFVKDWLEHNTIRADRKKNSIYKDLILEQMPETKLVESKTRADRKKKITKGQPNDNHGTSQGQPKDCIGKVRLGKVRLGKVRLDDDSKKKSTSSVFNFYNKNFGLITEHIAEEIGHFLEDGIEEALLLKTLEIAVENNVTKWNYSKSILMDCVSKNIQTLEQFNIKEQHREKPKTITNGFKKQMDNTNNASFRDFEEPKTFDMEEFIKEKGIK